jgi:hypothetical protein
VGVFYDWTGIFWLPVYPLQSGIACPGMAESL